MTDHTLSPSTWIDQPASRLDRRTVTITALLALIVLLAALLRLANLEAVGDGNTYYTAAVRSMLTSPHNFFFAAAEPGGSVTVDKPPLGLWLQALSALLLGVNGFAVVLPQIIAGVLSVLVLYHLVRRAWGAGAGLLAAFILAVTPIAVAVDRNNTMDSLLVLALLLAAWALMRSAERGRLGMLLLGAVLVGLAFNIKMLQAFLPLPAFLALYALTAPLSWGRKTGHLLAAAAALAVVSLSWSVIVDLTPADQRPYVGSSESNSALELIVGYNGLGRLVGVEGGPRGGPAPVVGLVMGSMTTVEAGEPGLTRLFRLPLANEASWLLIPALVALLGLAAWGLRPGLRALRAPSGVSADTCAVLTAVIVWGGWLLAGMVFFTVGQFFHAYYLVMIAPPAAALAAIGARALWTVIERRRLAGALLLGLVGGATLVFQAGIATERAAIHWGLLALLLMTGALGVAIGGRSGSSRLAAGGLVAAALALCAVPTVFSAWTMLDDSPNVLLPHTYDFDTADANPLGRVVPMSALTPEFIAYLESSTADAQYLAAVPNAQVGAELVIATGRPVLYIGGFNGSDTIVTPDQLAQMAAAGRLRYVWDSIGALRMTHPEIAAWVDQHCATVEDPIVPKPQIPGGALGQAVGGLLMPRGGLYDCAAA